MDLNIYEVLKEQSKQLKMKFPMLKQNNINYLLFFHYFYLKFFNGI